MSTAAFAPDSLDNVGETRRAARLVGILILLQMVGAFVVNGVLEAPLFGQPGFLETGVQHPRQVAIAALTAIVTQTLWVGIAITSLPILRRRTPALAMWLVALATASLALAFVENAALMSMLSLSQRYAAAGVDREQIETVRGVVASARNWTHYLARMLDGSMILLFAAALFRSSAIPRVLAGLGMLTPLSQITGLAMPLFGHPVNFVLIVPVGVTQLAIALWLIVKGVNTAGTAP